MVLLGTAILGNNRFAILQDGGTSGVPGVPGQSVVPMRIKLGDTVEGFRLSEVSEKRVVFAKGTATVEVPLDYFRKTDSAQPRVPVATQTSPAGQAAAPQMLHQDRQTCRGRECRGLSLLYHGETGNRLQENERAAI